MQFIILLFLTNPLTYLQNIKLSRVYSLLPVTALWLFMFVLTFI